ncbi:MAG: hypothetical protein F6K37_22800 [Moorea sp. SIO4E2]|uniref:hypothetical protein n=1 Tax=Moorena sp. SIO4E2 TaxID=2607826 RepID=UPI0013B7CE1E|nr:hypothetical protein [Moorena sp. SIO4E2]NEQ08673.1 hypothetical protein [Moorena sp. SIO4E2]
MKANSLKKCLIMVFGILLFTMSIQNPAWAYTRNSRCDLRYQFCSPFVVHALEEYQVMNNSHVNGKVLVYANNEARVALVDLDKLWFAVEETEEKYMEKGEFYEIKLTNEWKNQKVIVLDGDVVIGGYVDGYFEKDKWLTYDNFIDAMQSVGY